MRYIEYGVVADKTLPILAAKRIVVPLYYGVSHRLCASNAYDIVSFHRQVDKSNTQRRFQRQFGRANRISSTLARLKIWFVQQRQFIGGISVDQYGVGDATFHRLKQTIEKHGADLAAAIQAGNENATSRISMSADIGPRRDHDPNQTTNHCLVLFDLILGSSLIVCNQCNLSLYGVNAGLQDAMPNSRSDSRM